MNPVYPKYETGTDPRPALFADPAARARLAMASLVDLLEQQERKSRDARDTRILVLARELLAAIETRWA